jgi:hypothetical protein
MKQKVVIDKNNITPHSDDVFNLLGIPSGKADESTRELFAEAMAIYSDIVIPEGIFLEITNNQLTTVINGIGNTESECPFYEIFEEGNSQILFAVTTGFELTDKIAGLFEKDDYAVASMLDAIASTATENASNYLESEYNNLLINKNSEQITMQFSPGYCGWHVSAQQKLFDILDPSEIGISLNSSYLMNPLKSISGVIIQGEKDLFKIEDKYSFCKECKPKSCIDRNLKLTDEK